MTASRFTHWRSATVVGVLALVSLVPFSFMPGWAVPVGPVRLPLHFFVFVPIGAALLGYAARWSASKKRIPVFIAAAVGVAGTMALSSVANPPAFAEGLTATAGFLFRCVALGWFAYAACAEGDAEWLTAGMVVLAGLIAAGAIYEPLTGHFFLFKREITVEQHGGELWEPWRRIAVGAVGQPLPLASILNMWLPFTLWEWKKRRRWAWGVAAALVFLAILLTFRRSGYALAAATLAVFASTLGERRVLLAWLAGAVALFAVAVLAVPSSRQKISERFDVTATINEIRGSHRTQVYGVVMKMAENRPLLGVGPRQYEERYKEFAMYPVAWDTPDNQYLRFLAEGGILGLTAFLGLIACVLIPFRRARSESTPFLVSTAAFAASLLLFDGLYWPAAGMTFFAIAGAGLGRLDQIKELSK